MTRDDIIQMALKVIPQSAAFELKGHYEIERFAALVAAYERELCAKVCDDLVADGMRGTPEWNSGVLNCVAAIRARGEKL